MRRGSARVALVPEGSVFGEQVFFDGAPRSADVVAVSDGDLLELSTDALESLASRDPQLARTVLFDIDLPRVVDAPAPRAYVGDPGPKS